MANNYRDVNDAGIALIKRFEGCRLQAYKLTGESYYTIGYGHSYDNSITANTVWTQEQCEKALKEDLDKFEGYTTCAVTNITPNDNQYGALVSYCYNRGLGKTDGSNGLRQLVKNSNTVTEYAENFVKYWGTATAYKTGLIARRKAERELFLTDCLDTETELPSTSATLTNAQIILNIKAVQTWLNKDYAELIKACKLCGNKLLDVDGKNGNKTRTALTIALQAYLNELGAKLQIDGDYGTNTNNAVKKYIAVKLNNNTIASQIVQAILQIYGYNPQLFYPLFNADCVTALKECQSDHNLNADGIAGVIFFSTFIKQR